VLVFLVDLFVRPEYFEESRPVFSVVPSVDQ
jgi:hypothetical protein